MYRFVVTEFTLSEDGIENPGRTVLLQEKDSVNIPAILRAVNDMDVIGRKSRARKAKGTA